MTANKNRKRLIRQQARRTGEPYSNALRDLSVKWDKERAMADVLWRRIEKAEYGYVIRVPGDWEERPPDLRHHPFETARFVQPDDRRHLARVVRRPLNLGGGLIEMIEAARLGREALRFAEFSQCEIVVAGRPGVQVDSVLRDVGRLLAVREHFVGQGDIGFCLDVGTSVPDEDAELLSALAQGFELLAD